MTDKQVVKFEDYALSMDTAQGMAGLMKAASMLAPSDIIPDTFKNKPANVLIALEMANRMGASPFAVMQSMYIVYGNPSFSSKFLIACFNSCGRFTSIKYEFFGEPNADGYGCRAWATEKATGEVVKSIDVTISMAKAEGWYEKKGSKWKTMPQLMLQYRAATFLIRTVAPELAMGLRTDDEILDTIEVTPVVEQDSMEVAKEIEKINATSQVVDIPTPAVKVEEKQEAAAKTQQPKAAQPAWMK
ncbi:MAG: hypothetical protein IKK97_00310 [Phascolarctobacterium sp.]|nr:hypothetical protein [Phascolarctobacterium sp.]